MPFTIIALKDLRLLLRDSRSALILLFMPLAMILVLGLSLGEAFGSKPDDRIRISVVVLDQGPAVDMPGMPNKTWAEIVLDDLTNTGNVRVERIPSREEAEKLIANGDRSAIVVFEPEFSERIDRCSFVGEPFQAQPINPLYRDGMRTREIGVGVLRDPTQAVAASVIEQVVQVTLLRVVIPWMIGKAFDLIGTDPFMDRMEKHIPQLKLAYPFIGKKQLGDGIQAGIGAFFSSYQFRAKTWAGLTNSTPPPQRVENRSVYQSDAEGFLTLKRGTARYQILVPSYTVTFAFFLVLTVGWLFVAERRHGTLVRLRLAPISRGQILLGKLLPCMAISVLQGVFLLVCGKLIFGMSWGSQPWLLLPVVLCTSFAAVGLSMLVAGLAKTETQVAVYGTLLVLMLAGLSGSLMPRDLMPEQMKQLSLLTPHAWALDAYSQLLTPDNPALNVSVVWTSCGVLSAFGLVLTLLAWWRLKLD